MDSNLALNIIMYISIAGMLFSGYLTYAELKGKCMKCISIANFPSCFYGFIMYLIVFVISLMGLKG